MGLPGLPVGDITDLWSETVVTDTLSGGELGGRMGMELMEGYRGKGTDQPTLRHQVPP